MRNEEVKLEQFTNDIMTDVALKRQKILDGVDKQLDKEYKVQEKILYAKAYEIIQDGLKVVEREKQEMIAKTLMDNKVKLLHKRTLIIDDVFEEVRNRLRAFTNSKEYLDYLINLIDKNLKLLHEGDKEIVINYSDEKHLDTLKKKFKYEISVERKQLDFIGGCKIIDKVHQLFIDGTFETLLMSKREAFLLDCKIAID
ncbi:MAG: V-type ATP synthase subunit E [Vallitaleaceae bacterium]|nr:V-type ATP synthase subunit E [Vallitaleaceae bacterium]